LSLQVCGYPGCPELIVKGKSYCKEHQHRTLQGYTRDRIRRAVLNRQGGVCALCGRVPEHPELDHVVPLDRGGTNDRSNLQVLCDVPCHADKTAAERRA